MLVTAVQQATYMGWSLEPHETTRTTQMAIKFYASASTSCFHMTMTSYDRCIIIWDFFLDSPLPFQIKVNGQSR